MTRTYEQLFEAALAERHKLMDEGREAKDGAFACTQAERLVILDRSPPCYELSAARDRICGLKITLADSSPDNSEGSL